MAVAGNPTGWEARLVRPVLSVENEKWRPLEEWLSAEDLAPVEG